VIDDALDLTERMVLGSIATHQTAIAEALNCLSGDQFRDPRHEHVFVAAAAVHYRGEPVSLASILAQLEHDGTINRGRNLTTEYVSRLGDNACLPAQISYHAEKIAGEAARRAVEKELRSALQALDVTELDDLPELGENLTAKFEILRATFGENTPGALGRAVERLTAELLDSSGLDTVPTLQPLVDGYLYRDTIARIIGPSGHMKSFVALDFAGHIGSGVDWRGHPVNQGLVLYLVAEGAAGIRKRVRAWEQHHQRTMVNVKFLPRPVQVGTGNEWAVLLEVCKQLRPVLIIFDTQARITVGAEENSAKEMGNVIHRLEALRAATGACVTLIHHQGLAGEHGRGSTAVKGALQTELRVNKKGKGDQTRVTVSSDKQKDDEELEDVVFRIEVVKINGEAKQNGTPATSVVLVPGEPLPEEASARSGGERKAVNRVCAVLRASSKPLTVQAIGDVLADQEFGPLKPRTIQNALTELAAAGDAVMAGMGGATNSAQLWSAHIDDTVAELS
jgi:AAA domain/DnaB-like helicase N terminal domain